MFADTQTCPNSRPNAMPSSGQKKQVIGCVYARVCAFMRASLPPLLTHTHTHTLSLSLSRSHTHTHTHTHSHSLAHALTLTLTHSLSVDDWRTLIVRSYAAEKRRPLLCPSRITANPYTVPAWPEETHQTETRLLFVL